jgi:hypothetical protein
VNNAGNLPFPSAQKWHNLVHSFGKVVKMGITFFLIFFVYSIIHALAYGFVLSVPVLGSMGVITDLIFIVVFGGIATIVAIAIAKKIGVFG